MNDNDVATRARAVLARLREDAAESKWIHVAASMDAGKWRATLPAHTTRLLGAAPALIRLADGAARLAGDAPDEWWSCEGGCHFCGAWFGADGTPYDKLTHADDCPVPAIDAALADLAALGGGADGEVGA